MNDSTTKSKETIMALLTNQDRVPIGTIDIEDLVEGLAEPTCRVADPPVDEWAAWAWDSQERQYRLVYQFEDGETDGEDQGEYPWADRLVRIELGPTPEERGYLGPGLSRGQ